MPKTAMGRGHRPKKGFDNPMARRCVPKLSGRDGACSQRRDVIPRHKARRDYFCGSEAESEFDFPWGAAHVRKTGAAPAQRPAGSMVYAEDAGTQEDASLWRRYSPKFAGRSSASCLREIRKIRAPGTFRAERIPREAGAGRFQIARWSRFSRYAARRLDILTAFASKLHGAGAVHPRKPRMGVFSKCPAKGAG